MGRAENQLQNACLEFLRLRGVMAWRNNTGAVKVGKKQYIRYGHPGSGDIFAIPFGTFLSIECKVRGNSATPIQREWMQAVIDAGGHALVARTIDDVADALEAIE